jgi:hypothetical protein
LAVVRPLLTDSAVPVPSAATATGPPSDEELEWALEMANLVVETYGSAAEQAGDAPALPAMVTWRWGIGDVMAVASGARPDAVEVPPARVRVSRRVRQAHLHDQERAAAAMRDPAALLPAERLLADAGRRLEERRFDTAVLAAAGAIEALLRGLMVAALRETGWAPGEALDRATRPPLDLLDDALLPSAADAMRPGRPWHDHFEELWHGPVAWVMSGGRVEPADAARALDVAGRAIRHVRRELAAAAQPPAG